MPALDTSGWSWRPHVPIRRVPHRFRITGEQLARPGQKLLTFAIQLRQGQQGLTNIRSQRARQIIQGCAILALQRGEQIAFDIPVESGMAHQSAKHADMAEIQMHIRYAQQGQ